MKPFLRITQPGRTLTAETAPGYQEALVKLIPSEVVGLYLGGKNAIEAYFGTGQKVEDAANAPAFWVAWTVLCLAGLIAYRSWATSDSSTGVPPEWPAIGLTTISFIVWVYSFGDVFKVLQPPLWHPLLATLFVLAWTFSVPLIHRRFFGAQQT